MTNFTPIHVGRRVLNVSFGSPAAVGSYQPQSVNFDGTNDFLTRGADLTGNADGKTISFAGWVAFSNATPSSAEVIYAAGTVGGGSACLLGRNATTGTIVLIARNSSGTLILNMTGPAIADTDQHHIAISIDLANSANRHFYLDGASQSPTWTTYTNDTIDFTQSNHFIGVNSDGSLNKLAGCLADLWIDPGTFVDFSDGPTLAKFVGASAASSVDLGSDGSTPTGTAPLMYFHDEVATWHTNDGSGGGFTENGALTACATNPPSASIQGGPSNSTVPSVLQSSSGGMAMSGTGANITPAVLQSGSGVMAPSGTGAQTIPSIRQRGLAAGASFSAAGTKGEGFRQNVGKMMR